MKKPALQRYRLLAQMGFFTLFTVTPLFDLFRYDLTEKHAYFLTYPWHLGIDELIAGTGDPSNAAANIILYLFLPVLGAGTLIIGVAWKWGRLYCGWLCPHFSVVETINRLMLIANGKHSVWDKKQTPPWEPDGTPAKRDKRYWLLVVPAAIGFAFAWAVVGLTYLMPPFQVYHGLLTFTLYPKEVIFLTAATTVLGLEFLFARHLFCRYGCAIGIFQSFAWIMNKKAMVVGFDRKRLTDCASCQQGAGSAGHTVLARQALRDSGNEFASPAGSACDAVCPMRLKPRNVKRWMFACTQCGQCISACATVNRDNPNGQLLRWVSNDAAKRNEAGFSALSNTDEDAGGKIERSASQ
uniref:Iron-sulfur cluster-binding protein n=1 Tax=Dechloromonas aromatica (strain RCB) TaxID=159087 RepID=Q47B55_DECAR